MANKSPSDDKALAHGIGQKMDANIAHAEANPAEPRPDIESAALNLFKMIKSSADMTNLETLGVKRGKSGQYKFQNSDSFETKFSDGSVRKGIHGLTLHATSHAQYNGPKCANCGRIHDLRLCSRCKKIRYCDRECQKFHWTVHKNECVPEEQK